MLNGNSKDRYWQAVHRLSDLVVRRNEDLIELESMATLPLSLSPAAGHVGRFDHQKARALLERVEQLTGMIDSALAEVRREADAAGMPAVDWIEMPETRHSRLSRTG